MGKSDKDRVGYGRPPIYTRFKKGVSGNPKGRPRKTKNLKTDLFEELNEKITVREGEQLIRISKQRAVVKTLTAKTLKGDPRTANTLVNLMLRFVAADLMQEDTDDTLDSQEAEVVAVLEERLVRRSKSKDR
jgi:uncharacterized protein DUF5681